MEILQQGLTVAFQLALAIHLARNDSQFQTQIFFGNFIASIKVSRIKGREFLNLEDDVYIRAIVHIVDPGSHIVKKTRIVKAEHRCLNLLGKRRRGVCLSITDIDTAQYGAFVHILGTIHHNLADLVFRHETIRHFQKLCSSHRHNGQYQENHS